MKHKKITFLDLNNPILKENGNLKTANLGALYIIASLEHNGYEVDYRDYQLSNYYNQLNIGNIVSFADNCEDILLICCMAYILPLVVLSVKKIKERYPEKVIILGGVGPTGVASKLITEFREIDIISKGEGEVTVIEILDALEVNDPKGRIDALKKVNGIVFRDLESNIIVTNERERNTNLDSIKFPAYNSIEMGEYDEFGLITGRGCAYKCKFCDIHGLWGDKYLCRSLDNVFQEINVLVKDFGISKISIWDDTFTMNEKRVVEFCKRAKTEKLDFKWSCFGRVNLVNDRLIETMADAGCNQIFYGLESGSEKILKKIEKNITLDSMITAIETTVKHMEVKGHLIWGFPFEECDDLYKTVYLFNYLKEKINISMSQLWPYPTSPLYKEYSRLTRFNPNLGEFEKILPFADEDKNDKNEVLKLIQSHQDIFTQFCYYHTDNFMDKHKIIKNMDKLY
jgi:radical SAM superfamily enzyme YgiQ (UPF0313 family)